MKKNQTKNLKYDLALVDKENYRKKSFINRGIPNSSENLTNALNYLKKKSFSSFIRLIQNIPEDSLLYLLSPSAALYGRIVNKTFDKLTVVRSGFKLQMLKNESSNSPFVLIVQSPAILYRKKLLSINNTDRYKKALLLGIIFDYIRWRKISHGKNNSDFLFDFPKKVAALSDGAFSVQSIRDHLDIFSFHSLDPILEILKTIRVSIDQAITILERIIKNDLNTVFHEPTYSKKEVTDTLNLDASVFSPSHSWYRLLQKRDPSTGNAIVTAKALQNKYRKARRWKGAAPFYTEEQICRLFKCQSFIYISL
jgi:hypothetical protein